MDCDLRYASQIPITIQNNSDMCYSMVQSRSESSSAAAPSGGVTTTVQSTTITTPITTLPTTSVTAASQMGINAGIGNLNNMCSGSSSTDIAIVTDDRVYIYDDMASLMTGPCSGPHFLASIFTGYSGAQSLPAPYNVICIMVHQSNEMDMYDNYQSWRWQAHSGSLYGQSSQSFPKSISANIGGTPPINSDWCVNREKNGRQDRFFYNNGMLYLYSSQSPYTDTFSPSATGKYVNGYNINPWTQLPSEKIKAVFSITINSDDFIMIGESGQIYRYQMDHLTNSNDPPITVTTLGTLVI